MVFHHDIHKNTRSICCHVQYSLWEITNHQRWPTTYSGAILPQSLKLNWGTVYGYHRWQTLRHYKLGHVPNPGFERIISGIVSNQQPVIFCWRTTINNHWADRHGLKIGSRCNVWSEIYCSRGGWSVRDFYPSIWSLNSVSYYKIIRNAAHEWFMIFNVWGSRYSFYTNHFLFPLRLRTQGGLR